MDFYTLMKTSADKEGIPFSEKEFEKFVIYKDLLKEWNEKINLTAITDDEGIFKKHFIDCLKIFRFPEFKNLKKVIDVGTGAGFPGLPIKILSPDTEVVLLDSLNKRINFLDEVISKLDLQKISTIHSRAEDGARKPELRESFDAVVSRAVANMAVLSEYTLPYVKVGGYLIALKGPAIETEIMEGKNAIATLGGKIEDIIEVEVEGTDLNHNLVVVRKIKETSKLYPRTAGVISKRPIK